VEDGQGEESDAGSVSDSATRPALPRQYQPEEDSDSRSNKHQSGTDKTKNATTGSSREQVQDILWRIVTGDRSFFSVQTMQNHHAALSAPFKTQYAMLDENDDRKRPWDEKMISWFGADGVERLQRFLVGARRTCTYLEFAVWLRRYVLLGNFLLGGINPCLRGKSHDDARGSFDVGADPSPLSSVMDSIGRILQTKLFSNFIPVTLMSYVVTRVLEMRKLAWDDESGRDGRRDECRICSEQIQPDLELCFDAKCQHRFCEPCLWKDIMENLNRRQGDVVICPICERDDKDGKQEHQFAPPSLSHCIPCDPNESAQLISAAHVRKEQSLDAYQRLPVDSKALKRATHTRKRLAKGQDVLCARWSDAVKPSIGQSQSVRLDKFFYFLERNNALPFVAGCLEGGVDVDARNEYGQTALFIAVWKGYVDMVGLLLHYGSNPNAEDGAGVSCMDLARYHGYQEIASVLQVYEASVSQNCDTEWIALFSGNTASSPSVETLIPWSSDHLGAGSFIIDGMLSDDAVASLIELWKTLPVEPSKKKDSSLCSQRRYYCDVLGIISRYLQSIILEAFENGERDGAEQDQDRSVFVHPHMRYLCYLNSGSVLAPHQDLSRIDVASGRRSTHSFLLYLTDCMHGGETALLVDLSGEGRNQIHSCVKPRRGRLLLFPHRCPHEGLCVDDVPKLLIRGEVYLAGP
jgi:2OG-Fe(II) oxygenase superfamily/Ankyrin repeats (many copies)